MSQAQGELLLSIAHRSTGMVVRAALILVYTSSLLMTPYAVAKSHLAPAQLIDTWQNLNFVVVGAQDGFLNLEKNAEALKLKVTKAAPYTYYPQIMLSVNEPIDAGSRVVLRFKGRSKNNLFVDTALEHSSAGEYERVLKSRKVLSPEWHEYTVEMVATKDLPRNWGSLEFHVPRKVGEIELSNIQLEDWGKQKPKNLQPEFSYQNPFAGHDLNPQFWIDADRRIDRIRKGDLKLSVRDSSQNPVAGAKVRITQITSAFKFGTAISAPHTLTETRDSKNYKRKLLSLFNCATPENALKWPQQDYDQPGTAMKLVDWCNSHNLSVRGHYLVEPLFIDIPKAQRNLRGEKLRALIKSHTQDYVSQYRGKVYVWDALNEAILNHEIQDNLGASILKDVYVWAHDADNSVLLGYNDYDILNNEDGSNDGRRIATNSFIKSLLQEQTPLSSLGIQSHMHLPLPHGDAILNILDEWGAFKQPIEITEYDLATKDDALQAEYLREFLTAIFSHESVKSFVMWGFWDGSFYDVNECNTLFTKNWKPRLAALVLKELLMKWSTDESLITDANGTAKSRSFLGTLQIEVQKGKRIARKTIELSDPNSELAVQIDL